MSRKKIVVVPTFLFLLAGLPSGAFSRSDGPADFQPTAGDSLGEEYTVYPINPDISFAYRRPTLFGFIRPGLHDILTNTRNLYRKENAVEIALMIAGTAVLVACDQQILDAAQDLGERLDLSSDNYLKPYITIGDISIFEGPYDLGSALYFIGDGWTNFSVVAGYFTFGLIKDDVRALQTANQLAEGLVSTGLATQILKHITGRESPFVATAPGGRWHPFPNQIDYHRHVPRYDAYPSGHLAVAMMTVTVVAENYPEYWFIRPLGYTLMGLLGYQMLNNGVHWFSDYPLAIAMGYSFARLSIDRERKVIHRGGNAGLPEKTSWTDTFSISPGYYGNGVAGLNVRFSFD